MIIKPYQHNNTDTWFRIKRQEPDKVFINYIRGRGEFSVASDIAIERRIKTREKFMPKLSHIKPLTYSKSLNLSHPTNKNLTQEAKKAHFIVKFKKRGFIYI